MRRTESPAQRGINQMLCTPAGICGAPVMDAIKQAAGWMGVGFGGQRSELRNTFVSHHMDEARLGSVHGEQAHLGTGREKKQYGT